MKSIKKLIYISILALGISTISNADFTFSGYTFQSTPVLSYEEVKDNDNNNLLLKVNAKDEKISRKINNRILKVFNTVAKNSDVTKVEVTSNNSKFLSLVIVSSKLNPETKNYEYSFKGLNFDVETGNELALKDIFVEYKNALKDSLNYRIKQFGVNTIDKFKSFDSVSSFYMEDDAIVFIFDKGKATNDYDGVLFIPFYLYNLQGILK